ncbi:MAG: hypothetical protein SV598_12485 [Pseudomonadota bacterium]|nr:hypothetical protein [Pseudomonadota bacterium]
MATSPAAVPCRSRRRALTFRIGNGDWFVNVLSCHQELDIKKAILTRTIRFRDPDGRHTRVNQRRLVSIEHPHLAALETSIHAEDWTGSIC